MDWTALLSFAQIMVQQLLEKKLSFPRKIQKTNDRKFFLPLDLWF
jgi:hypothetical protein